MKISIIIPAFNEEKYIKYCLESVFKYTSDVHEIIVVNNASTDKTKEIAESFLGVSVVNEDKKGITRARQAGFEYASGEILAYIDADTRLTAGWFETLKNRFSQDKNLVCLSGPYIFFDIPFWKRDLINVLYWRILAYPTYKIVGYMAIGGNFAIKRNVIEKMNGFDTSIDFYGEDTNTARRASQFGKVKFDLEFPILTSGRRIEEQGLLKTAVIYVMNFFSEVIIKKPITNIYKDVR
jgi:glycosyltransferase involved in cell wall biosynthesis